MNIQYHIGDATLPGNQYELPQHTPVIIAHIVNNVAKYGSGFTRALSSTYGKMVENEFRSWANNNGKYLTPYELGQVQLVKIHGKDGLYIANMCAQNGIRKSKTDTAVYVDYPALHQSLFVLKMISITLMDNSNEDQIHIQMPRIGCGLGGGSWDLVLPLIKDALNDKSIYVHVYDLKH